MAERVGVLKVDLENINEMGRNQLSPIGGIISALRLFSTAFAPFLFFAAFSGAMSLRMSLDADTRRELLRQLPGGILSPR
jgi:hypothetical protein